MAENPVQVSSMDETNQGLEALQRTVMQQRQIASQHRLQERGYQHEMKMQELAAKQKDREHELQMEMQRRQLESAEGIEGMRQQGWDKQRQAQMEMQQQEQAFEAKQAEKVMDHENKLRQQERQLQIQLATNDLASAEKRAELTERMQQQAMEREGRLGTELATMGKKGVESQRALQQIFTGDPTQGDPGLIAIAGDTLGGQAMNELWSANPDFMLELMARVEAGDDVSSFLRESLRGEAGEKGKEKAGSMLMMLHPVLRPVEMTKYGIKKGTEALKEMFGVQRKFTNEEVDQMMVAGYMAQAALVAEADRTGGRIADSKDWELGRQAMQHLAAATVAPDEQTRNNHKMEAQKILNQEGLSYLVGEWVEAQDKWLDREIKELENQYDNTEVVEKYAKENGINTRQAKDILHARMEAMARGRDVIKTYNSIEGLPPTGEGYRAAVQGWMGKTAETLAQEPGSASEIATQITAGFANDERRAEMRQQLEKAITTVRETHTEVELLDKKIKDLEKGRKSSELKDELELIQADIAARRQGLQELEQLTEEQFAEPEEAGFME